MPIFSRKSPFDPEKVDWLFASFEWLLANYGGYDSFLSSYHLVLNNKKDFPVSNRSEKEFVHSTFRSIMTHMGMGNWDVDLIPLSEAGEQDYEWDESELSMDTSRDGVSGFFSLDELGRATIGYGDDLSRNFTQLVSVLSHEASHYLLTKSITEMPGGWVNLEPITDLTAIFTGFGVFHCNESPIVRHSADGVTSQQSGYLPESARAYALAIFSELSMLEMKYVAKQLRLNPRQLFKAAVKDIRETKGERMHHLESLTPLRLW